MSALTGLNPFAAPAGPAPARQDAGGGAPGDDGQAWLRAVVAAGGAAAAAPAPAAQGQALQSLAAQRLFELRSMTPTPQPTQPLAVPDGAGRTPFAAASALRWCPDAAAPMPAAALSAPASPAPRASAGAPATMSDAPGKPAAVAESPSAAHPVAAGAPEAMAADIPIAVYGATGGEAADRPGAAAAAPGALEDAVAAALPPRAENPPVRVHVQWREPGRVADVWIGLHRSALDRLPEVRTAVVRWLAARGGRLGRLTCNGAGLDAAAAP